MGYVWTPILINIRLCSTNSRNNFNRNIKGFRMIKKCGLILITIFMFAFPPPNSAFASDYTKIQSVIQQSDSILNQFDIEQTHEGLKSNLRAAKAIFVIPQMLRGGFVIGGSGGSGVLVSRDMKEDTWGYPVFYSMGSISFGLQIGAEASELILLVMTEKGMDSLLTTSFKLGADCTIAAGPIGAGAKATTADIYAYAKSKGAYGGLSIEGAMVKTKADWNYIYYNKPVSPADIVIRRSVMNPDADQLRNTLSKITKQTFKKLDY